MKNQNNCNFQYLPDKYKQLFENIPKKCKEIFDLLTISLTFRYFNYEKVSKQDFEFFEYELKECKFLVYQILSSKQYEQLFSNFYEINKLDQSKINVIICKEGECIIIEKISEYEFNEIIKTIPGIKLNSPKVFEEDIPLKRVFASNPILQFIINPILAFLVKRYYYPTNYFKDPSFFKFNYKYDNNFDIDFETFIKIQGIFGQFEITDNFQYFNKDDLICLKRLNNKISIVFHTKSRYLFAKKDLRFDSDKKYIKREFDFSEQISHPCFIRCYGFYIDSNCISLIYDHMCHDDLYNFLSDNVVNPFFSFMTINRVSRGIKYLHSNSIIHRDLTPRNILINHDFIPFISDYDIMRFYENSKETTKNLGSQKFGAPEQLSGGASFKTDIYSIGVLIFYLFCPKSEFENQNNYDFSNPLIIERFPSEMLELCKNCLKKNPNERPNLKEIQEILIEMTSSNSFLKYFHEDQIQNQNLKFDLMNFYEENKILLSLNEDKELSFRKLYPDFSEFLLSYGRIFYEGKSVEKNMKVSMKFFKLSAEFFKNTENLLKEGNLYFEDGPKQNRFIAKEYYKLAAKKTNDPDAWNILGFTYECSILYNWYGKAKAFKKAEKCYERAIKQKHALAYYNLGRLWLYDFLETRDPLKAINNYIESAKLGNIKASYEIGKLYIKGDKYVPKNIEKGVQILKDAAKVGYPVAICFLGEYYYERKDFRQAKEYFEIVSPQQNTRANFYLGLMYYNGDGIEQNFGKALEYFNISQNDPNSFYFLAKMHEDGKGTEKNKKKAIEYYKKCIETKENISKVYYGKVWEYYTIKNDYYYHAYNNIGVLELLENGDVDEASKYLWVALEYEHPCGKVNFSILKYIYKLGYSKTIDTLEQASSKENILMASFFLGYISETKNEIENAMKYYSKVFQDKNKPLKYHDKEINDENIFFSNLFIVILSSLKIANYLLQSNNIDENKKANPYLIDIIYRMLDSLLKYKNNQSYSFQFIKMNQNGYCINNLEDFILNFPFFNNSTHKLDEKSSWKIDSEPSSKIYIKIENKSKIDLTNEKASTSKNETANKIIDTSNLDIKEKMENNQIKNEISSKNGEELKNYFVIEKDSNSKNALEIIDTEEIDQPNMIKLIQKTISSMREVLMKPPYFILFGRINDSIKNINN